MGHVASIINQKENDFVTNLQDDQDIWLGLRSKPLNEVKWWLDGNPVSYTNWYSNEPRETREFGKIIVPDDRNGKWESVSDDATFAYVCKRGIST